MKTLGEMLRDKFINGFIVALVFGIGTVNAISNIGASVLAQLFKVEGNPWNWKVFFGQLILYIALVITAIFLRWCSKLSAHPPQATHHHQSYSSEVQPEHHY